MNLRNPIYYIKNINFFYFPFYRNFFASMGNCNCTTDSEKEKLAEIINEEPSAPIEKKPS